MKKTSKIQTAKNYASALYDTVAATNNLDDVLRECASLEEAFANVADVRQLKNPAWKVEQKKDFALEVAQKLKLSAPMTNFLQIVVENGRLSELNLILNEFKHIFYQKGNIKEVIVESAVALSDAQNKKLIDALKQALQQDVVVKCIINPDVLGGLVVRSESLRIDDSLAGKLNRLEQVMKGKL